MVLRDDELPLNDGSLEIHTLYAWVAEENTGIESILVRPTHAGLVPLVSADEQRAMKLHPWARTAARARRKPAKLVRFTYAGVIAQVDP